MRTALNRLNIAHTPPETNLANGNDSNANLRIPQSNGYDLTLTWNGQEYEMVGDLSFWKQSSPVKSFMNRIAQAYTAEMIVGESQKLGFEPTNSDQTLDGSKIVTLEGWKNHEQLLIINNFTQKDYARSRFK